MQKLECVNCKAAAGQFDGETFILYDTKLPVYPEYLKFDCRICRQPTFFGAKKQKPHLKEPR